MKPMNLGGQAVMEGVMIQAPRKVCMAVRRKDGSITLCEDCLLYTSDPDLARVERAISTADEGFLHLHQ